jgi:hypothetical protein
MLKTAGGIATCLGVAVAAGTLATLPGAEAAAGFAGGIAINFGYQLCQRFHERALAYAERIWGLDKNEHIRQGLRRSEIAATRDLLRRWRQQLPRYNAATEDGSHGLASLITAWCDAEGKDSAIRSWAHSLGSADVASTSAALRTSFEMAFGGEVSKDVGIAEQARRARSLALNEAFEDVIEGGLAPVQWHRARFLRSSDGLKSFKQAFFREPSEGGGWFEAFLLAIGKEFKADAEFKRLWDSVQIGGISAMLLDDIKVSSERHQQLTEIVQAQSADLMDALVGIKDDTAAIRRQLAADSTKLEESNAKLDLLLARTEKGEVGYEESLKLRSNEAVMPIEIGAFFDYRYVLLCPCSTSELHDSRRIVQDLFPNEQFDPSVALKLHELSPLSLAEGQL